MNKGMSRKEAFKKTEESFRERREYLEREQKVMMAMAVDSGLQPMFSTGSAYLQVQKANIEAAHLQSIRQQLRRLKKAAQVVEQEGPAAQELEKTGASEDNSAAEAARRKKEQGLFGVAALRDDERVQQGHLERQRQELVGDVAAMPSVESMVSMDKDDFTSLLNAQAASFDTTSQPEDQSAGAMQDTEAAAKRPLETIDDEHQDTKSSSEEKQVPDSEDTFLGAQGAAATPSRAEDTIVVHAKKKSAEAPSRKKKDTEGMYRMVSGNRSGGVVGEDLVDEDLSARRRRNRDDNDDDWDDWDDFN